MNETQSEQEPRALIEEVKQTLRSWAPKDFTAFHHKVAQLRTEGTGESVRARKEVQDWDSIKNSFLWMRGGPGVGKTYVLCGLVEAADAIARKSKDTAVVCVYLRHDEEVTAWEILVDIVIQLLHQSTHIPGVATKVKEFLDPYRQRITKPLLSDLKKLLKTILPEFRKASIFVDGLDESKPDVQSELVETLPSAGAHVLFASRHLLPLEEELRQSPPESPFAFIDIVAEEVDLDIFIEAEIRCKPGFKALLTKFGIREEVVTTVKEKANGMFLHAFLHMKALHGCLSIRRFREVLDGFPTGISGLYEVTLGRIKRLPEEESTIALRTLIWVVHAKRTLTVAELRSAIAICPDSYEFSKDWEIDEEHILTACCGLVEVFEEHRKRKLRLIHFTAQESLPALLSNHSPTPPYLIIRTCLSRLCEFGYQKSRLKSYHELEASYFDHPLLRYAHIDGPRHIREHKGLSPDLLEYIEHFVVNCEAYPYYALDTWWEGFHILCPLHVAALFDMAELIIQLCRRGGIDINSPSIAQNREWSSLTVAAAEGCLSAVEALLCFPGIEPNIQYGDGTTPLMEASRRGHLSTVKVLIDYCTPEDVHRGSDNCNSALFLAAMRGHDDVVEALCASSETGVNTVDKFGRIPLHMACNREKTNVVACLLRVPGIDINHRDHHERTPLHDAIERINGHDITLIQLLTNAPGIDPNIENMWGRTPLIMAVEKYSGGITLLKHLLTLPTIDVNYRNLAGYTALGYALIRGNYVAAELLLCHPSNSLGAIPQNDNEWKEWTREELRSGDSSTFDAGAENEALVLASRVGDEEMVEFLLTSMPQIDVNAASSDNRWALEQAVDGGHLGVVRRLLAVPGIDVNAQGPSGMTALHVSCCLEDSTTCRALFDLFLDVPTIDANLRDHGGMSPLSTVIEFSQYELVEVLLNRPGIDINLQDNFGCPASFRLAYRPGAIPLSTLRLFLDHPSYMFDVTSVGGETILVLVLAYEFYRWDDWHIGIEFPDPQDNHPEATAHLLLDYPDLQKLAGTPDNEGWTPLILASKFGYQSIVERLLPLPAVDINAKNNDGESALDLALEGCELAEGRKQRSRKQVYEEIVCLLRQAGAV